MKLHQTATDSIRLYPSEYYSEEEKEEMVEFDFKWFNWTTKRGTYAIRYSVDEKEFWCRVNSFVYT